MLAHFVDYAGALSIKDGMLAGFWAWLGFVVTTALGSVLWEGKSKTAYFINIGFHLVSLLAMGGILGWWQ